MRELSVSLPSRGVETRGGPECPRRQRSRARLALPAALAIHAGLLGTAVDASECPFRSQGEPYHDQPVSVDFVPWIPLDADIAADLRDATCLFVAVSGGDDVPADVDLVPAAEDVTDDTSLAMAWFRPATQFAAGTRYAIRCDTVDLSLISPEFDVTSGVAGPVPSVGVGDVERTKQGGECSCSEDGLLLTLSGTLDEQFFAQGGVLLVAFAPDRVTYASQFFGSGSVSIPLPGREDDYITVTPISGAQQSGTPIEVDVRGLSGEDSGCRHAPRSPAWLTAVLIVGSISLTRRRRPPATEPAIAVGTLVVGRPGRPPHSGHATGVEDDDAEQPWAVLQGGDEHHAGDGEREVLRGDVGGAVREAGVNGGM